MRTLLCGLGAFLAVVVTSGVAQAGDVQATLRLLSARDHIEGSFTTSQSVYADRNRIYLVSAQGELFVLARDRSSDFALLQEITGTVKLNAVRGDEHFLYVAAADGLRVYRKGDPVVLVKTVHVGSIDHLSSLAVTSDRVYVSWAQMTIDPAHLYLAPLNPGELAYAVDKETLTTIVTYGETYEPGLTVAYDRETGQRVGAIPSPVDIFGRPGLVSLYADAGVLALASGGCCGVALFLHDPTTLEATQVIGGNANAVVRRERWLVVGDEYGRVNAYDFGELPSPRVALTDLRQLTGHNGAEDIETRSLWMDGEDNLVFAASSWGNDQTRGPTLPSFFVLERSESPAEARAPANDGFAAARSLRQASGEVTGTNVGATKEAGEPAHADDAGGASVWYRWTAAADGTVTFDTVGSSFDALLAVYTGTNLPTLTPLAANDDIDNPAHNYQSRVSFNVTAGTTYRIAVDGWHDTDGARTGPLQLNWSFAASPANDAFAAAHVLSEASGEVSGTNVGAAKEAGEPAHAGSAGGASVWYRWTAPAGGTVTFDTVGSSFDTLLAVYSGTNLATLNPIAADDDIDNPARNYQSRVSFNATAGTTYWIAVDGWRDTTEAQTGPLQLNWSFEY